MKHYFLPGFLGCKEDWDAVFSSLPHLEKEALDWVEIEKGCPKGTFHLIGYSMGGRVAARWAHEHPKRVASLTLLSAHLGLPTEKEKKARVRQDILLAEKLRTLPISAFLKMWYSQPLFSNFTYPKRRESVDAELHARLLIKYSLGKQPSYWNTLSVPTLYLVGEKDTRYLNLKHKFPMRVIPDAGHVLHLEAPEKVAQEILETIS